MPSPATLAARFNFSARPCGSENELDWPWVRRSSSSARALPAPWREDARPIPDTTQPPAPTSVRPPAKMPPTITAAVTAFSASRPFFGRDVIVDDGLHRLHSGRTVDSLVEPIPPEPDFLALFGGKNFPDVLDQGHAIWRIG